VTGADVLTKREEPRAADYQNTRPRIGVDYPLARNGFARENGPSAKGYFAEKHDREVVGGKKEAAVVVKLLICRTNTAKKLAYLLKGHKTECAAARKGFAVHSRLLVLRVSGGGVFAFK
jgi:hypothetical protein